MTFTAAGSLCSTSGQKSPVSISNRLDCSAACAWLTRTLLLNSDISPTIAPGSKVTMGTPPVVTSIDPDSRMKKLVPVEPSAMITSPGATETCRPRATIWRYSLSLSSVSGLIRVRVSPYIASPFTRQD